MNMCTLEDIFPLPFVTHHLLAVYLFPLLKPMQFVSYMELFANTHRGMSVAFYQQLQPLIQTGI